MERETFRFMIEEELKRHIEKGTINRRYLQNNFEFLYSQIGAVSCEHDVKSFAKFLAGIAQGGYTAGILREHSEDVPDQIDGFEGWPINIK